MKLQCTVLVTGLGWFTLIPNTASEINCSSAIEIGTRLIEMVSGVKRVEFTREDEEKIKKSIVIIRCSRCNIPNFIDPNYVHGENGDPFQWHCTFCTNEIPKLTEVVI